MPKISEVREPKSVTAIKSLALKNTIIELLRHQKINYISEIAKSLDLKVSDVKKILVDIKREGYVTEFSNHDIVELRTILPKAPPQRIDVAKLTSGGHIKIGVVSDNHLASQYERMDILNALYDIFAQEGVTEVYQTGNIVEGEAEFNMYDLKVTGLSRQTDYLIDNFPVRKGIVTKFITGDDHEGWWTQREKIDVGRYIENEAMRQGREDLKYLGYLEADVEFKTSRGAVIMRLFHPSGGVPYAISYPVQKIVESYTNDKPHILLCGHYHQAGYLHIRNVHTILTATTKDQDVYLRKKHLAPQLGGWILEFHLSPDGTVPRFKQEFISFFDSNYYKSRGFYR